MDQINFKKERDLGATLEVASTFIKQNFGRIMKPTLVVVVIPLVLGAVLMVIGMRNIYSNIGTNDPTQIFSSFEALVPAYLLIMITFMLANVMYIGYIKLYTEGLEEITLNDLLPIVKSKALTLFLSSILLVIILYIGMLLCVLPGIYLAIVFAHFFPIYIIEGNGFGASWKRSFFLIKDNWWSSFGLYIVTYLISLGMMILVYIPVYAIMGVQIFSAAKENDPTAMMSSMSSMAYVTPVYYVVGLLVALLYSTITSLRYFSLVEKKEGTGELEQISKL